MGNECYIYMVGADSMMFYVGPNGGWVLYLYGSSCYYGALLGPQWGMGICIIPPGIIVLYLGYLWGIRRMSVAPGVVINDSTNGVAAIISWLNIHRGTISTVYYTYKSRTNRAGLTSVHRNYYLYGITTVSGGMKRRIWYLYGFFIN